MFAHFTEALFLENLLRILIASLCIGGLLFFIYFIIYRALGKYRGHAVLVNYEVVDYLLPVRCAPYFIGMGGFGAALFAIAWYGGDTITGWVIEPVTREMKTELAETMLSKDRARLYDYYQQLSARRKEQQAYYTRLETKVSELQYQEAKNKVHEEMSRTAKELRSLDASLTTLTDYSTRLYFSRLLQELGANVDASELEAAMDTIEHQSQQAEQQTNKTAE